MAALIRTARLHARACERVPQTRTTISTCSPNRPTAAESLRRPVPSGLAAEDAVVRLERIPAILPCADRAEWKSIGVPTLVLGQPPGPHPSLRFAETSAAAIPGASFGADAQVGQPSDPCRRRRAGSRPISSRPHSVLGTSSHAEMLHLALVGRPDQPRGRDQPRRAVLRAVPPRRGRRPLRADMLFFPDLVKPLAAADTRLPFEVHLMTTDPLVVGRSVRRRRRRRDHLLPRLGRRPRPRDRSHQGRGKLAGISLLDHRGLDLLEPYWPDLDVVTIVGTAMGIKGASMDARRPRQDPPGARDDRGPRAQGRDRGRRRHPPPDRAALARRRGRLDRAGFAHVRRGSRGDAAVARGLVN